MKEHIKLILISIPLTLGLLVLHTFLLSQGWAISIISEFEIQNKTLLQAMFFLENVITSIFVVIPYALVIAWVVSIKPKTLSLLSVFYFFTIYAIGFVVQVSATSLEGLFNRIIFIVCLLLLLAIFLISNWKQKSV